MKRFGVILLLFVLIISVFVLSSCDMEEVAPEAKALAEELMDCVIENDRTSAKAMFKGVSTSDFNAFWNELRSIYDGATEYTMLQTGLSSKIDDGVKTITVVLRIQGDNGGVGQLTLTYNGDLALIGVHVVNLTPETYSIFASLGMVLLSLAFVAFSIWMIVDAAKRNIKYKALWIVICCLTTVVTVMTATGGDFDFNWSLSGFVNVGYLFATASTVTVRIVLPIGAIIYFFARKTLPAPTLPPPPITPPTFTPPMGTPSTDETPKDEFSADLDTSTTWDEPFDAPVDTAADTLTDTTDNQT